MMVPYTLSQRYCQSMLVSFAKQNHQLLCYQRPENTRDTYSLLDSIAPILRNDHGTTVFRLLHKLLQSLFRDVRHDQRAISGQFPPQIQGHGVAHDAEACSTLVYDNHSRPGRCPNKGDIILDTQHCDLC